MDSLEQTIKKYCGSLEERFDACKDKVVAELLKEQICWEFKQANNKVLSFEDVEFYLDTLIRKKVTVHRVDTERMNSHR